MATWEDGPEYAPIEAPERFTVPDVPPLDEAPPPPQLPAAPAERPQFGDPEAAVTPLATLDPDKDSGHRDPNKPFDVDSGTMTEGNEGNKGGAWGAAHWRPPTGPPVGQPGPWGPQLSNPGDPNAPVGLQSGPPAPVGNLPAPGTPGWFGPGPMTPAPRRPPTLWQATPPGAIIALAVSILFVLSPFAFVTGLLLSLRARYAKRAILTAYAVVGGLIMLITVVGTLSSYGTFGDWFASSRGWFLLGSAVMVVLTLVLVNNELKNGPRGGSAPGGYPPPPPYQP